MNYVIIHDFGKDTQGFHIWRVHSSDKKEIESFIKELFQSGYIFGEEPLIESSYKSWSVLLKLLEPMRYAK